ncbi:unnamed protein product [Heligmosomoides polygyrus]|uniref:Uncharacterized protein n=1 Tax=Heligmosomoides polygyrus TaxID=6339 RepID=A0A3P8C7I6_HELPZ|nr:unnamed protein product [Heligmosomoides polygyrus]
MKNPFYAIDMPISYCDQPTGCGTRHASLDGIQMTVDANFAFLSKIPDQCGYIVFADGAIVKSDGDLSNRESTMSVVEKITSVSSTSIPPSTKFNQITVSYPDHFYTISQSGKYTFVVKRKVHA